MEVLFWEQQSKGTSRPISSFIFTFLPLPPQPGTVLMVPHQKSIALELGYLDFSGPDMPMSLN